jgi:hypothetical protein
MAAGNVSVQLTAQHVFWDVTPCSLVYGQLVITLHSVRIVHRWRRENLRSPRPQTGRSLQRRGWFSSLREAPNR